MPLNLPAIILTWNGSSSNLISEAANWDEGLAPDGDDSLVFAGTVNSTVTNDLAAGTQIEGIEFTNTANGESFNLAGNRILLSGNIQTTAVADPSTESIEDTISFDIELSTANLGINTGSGHSAQVSGVVSGSQELDINNGTNEQDDGIVILSAANTYSGGTRLMGGRLVLQNDAALGSGALLVEDRSNTNPVLSIGQNGLTIGNDITFSDQGGSKTILFDVAGSNTAEMTGNLILNETGGTNNRIAVGADNVLTYSGVISGDGRLVLHRSSTGGTLVLTNANTFTGGFLLEEGTLRLENDNALGTGLLTIQDRGVNPIVDLAGGLTIANDITITNRGGNKRIQVTGTGSLNATLNGAILIEETAQRNFDFLVGGDDTLTVNGLVSGTAGAGVEKLNGGTLVLANNANSFAGDLYITSGTVEAETIGDIGLNSAIGSGSIVYLGGNDTSGTLRYTGSGESSNRQFSVGRRYGNTNRIGSGTLLNDG
ncbi:MAG: autotransporter-associated beta strand repeat-containing protein, partial [Verrucomicrobiota bacterium]